MRKHILLTLTALAVNANLLWAQHDFDAMDYRLQQWPEAERFQSAQGPEHLFLSGSAGCLFSFTEDGGYNPFRSGQNGMTATVYAGKWLTPRHGIRAGVHAAFLPHPETRIKMAGVSADYLLNLSVLTAGYNPDRLFEVYGLAGLGADMACQADGDNRRIHPSAYLGLQGQFRLSPITAFFVEPRLQLASDGYDGQTHWRGYDAAFALQAGLTYQILERSKQAPTGTFGLLPFGNHTFISFATGINCLVSRSYQVAPGPELSLYAGKWLAPHSALRLGITGGLSYLNHPDDARHRHKFAGGRADYLLNLNNLCGYYRQNPFELTLLAGVSLAAGSSYLDREERLTTGISAGVQGSFRISDHTSLFLEPRLTLYPKDFASGVSFRKHDLFAELAAGVTLHTASRTERRKTEQPETDSFWDQTFLQAGAGMEMLATPATLIHPNMMGPNGYLAIGKWWNARSGARLGADAGWTKDRYATGNSHLFNGSISADYLWNLTNSLYGYDSNRTFHLVVSAGAVVTARAGNGYPKALYAGVETGLLGLWRLNRQISLFAEPELRVYGQGLSPAYSVRNRFTVMPLLRAGVQFGMQDYDRSSYHARFGENDHRSFVSLSAGGNFIAGRPLFDNRSASISASIGQWYTPLSGWRTNFLVHRGSYGNRLHYQYAGVEADYLFNLSTLYAGYDPERLFSLHVLAGAGAGVSYIQGSLKLAGGVHAGLQADFRLNPALHLFIEPKAEIYSRHYGYRYQSVVPVAGLTAGITHYFRQRGKHTGSTPDKSSFVILGTGLGLYSGASSSTPTGQLLSKSCDIAYGHWFTHLHGLQAGLSNTHLNVLPDTPLNFLTLKADYLLSLSSLLAGNDDTRCVTLDGLAGVLLNLPTGNSVSETSFGAEAGLRATFRLNQAAGIYLQPVFRIYDSRLNRTGKTRSKADAAGALEAGIRYRF